MGLFDSLKTEREKLKEDDKWVGAEAGQRIKHDGKWVKPR